MSEPTTSEANGNAYIIGAFFFSVAFGFYVDSSGISVAFMTFGGLLMAGALYAGRK